jgi:hypothetical protein
VAKSIEQTKVEHPKDVNAPTNLFMGILAHVRGDCGNVTLSRHFAAALGPGKL